MLPEASESTSRCKDWGGVWLWDALDVAQLWHPRAGDGDLWTVNTAGLEVRPMGGAQFIVYTNNISAERLSLAC